VSSTSSRQVSRKTAGTSGSSTAAVWTARQNDLTGKRRYAPRVASVPGPRPLLRGVSHLAAFVAAVPVGITLGLAADTAVERAGAIAFAASVVTMFGASALYHRVMWKPRVRPWIRRLDHAMIFALIAGTYTPVGLIVLRGEWRITILAIVWSGAAAAILVKLFWVDAPKWLAVAIAVTLGWVGVIIFPQIFDRVGVGGAVLLLIGGVAYTVGAIVYALKRPDPVPAVFGYHEIFHAFVIAAVACQYVAVAFFVLPHA
jgi:hemolysin III